MGTKTKQNQISGKPKGATLADSDRRGMWLFSRLLCESDQVNLVRELLCEWFWFLIWSLGNLVQNSHLKSLSKCFALKVSVFPKLVVWWPIILAEAGGLPQTQSLPRLHNRFCLGQTKPSPPPQRKQSPTADSFGQDGPLSNQVIEIERGQKTLSGSTQGPYQT